MNVIQHNKVAHLHNDKDIIFCKTDYLEVLFYNLRDCKDNVTLITGNSDYAITNEIVSKAPPCVKLWFGQAMNSNWDICRSIPLHPRRSTRIWTPRSSVQAGCNGKSTSYYPY